MRQTIGHDFHLAFEADGEDYVCRVLRSLEGRCKGTFRPPPPVASGDDTGLRQDAEARGRALFEALFHGEVGEKLRRSLKKLEGARSGRGPRRRLRIRLAIDPDADRLASLHQLAWEEMFDPDGDRFLARSSEIGLIRDLELSVPLLDLPGTHPPRLLVVAAEPRGCKALDVDGEIERIAKVLDGRTIELLEPLRHATLHRLEDRLDAGEPHILHVVAHGKVDEAEVEGLLCFERQDGSPHRISGKQLAERLAGLPHLRLVVLNACSSGEGPEKYPARGVAASLLKAGVPAVVAMRKPIHDVAGVGFSDGFYRALARGHEVDAAVSIARREIDDVDPCFEEWALPALFMSSEDGRLFNFGGETEVARMRPKRLGIKTRNHPFGPLEASSDHVLDLVPLFDGRPIKDPEDWTDKVLPYLDHFLRQHVVSHRPLHLRLDAHLTVSFAAGRLTDTRGIDVTISQATRGGFIDWRYDPAQRYDGPLWREPTIETFGGGKELAVAAGITNANLGSVKRYVERHLGDRVGRILAVTPDPAPGNDSVRDANHAWALADELKRLIDQAEREGPLHLYLAAPGAFAFYLGQISRGFGEIQLYEWPFEEKDPKDYLPSLRIVPEKGGRR